jgi:hypothetical protein
VNTESHHSYGWLERAVMRVLFGLVVLHHMPHALFYDSLPAPNGLARVIDLRFLLDPAVFNACRYALYGAVILYVLRIGWAVVLPYMTLLSAAVGSVINSHGAIAHYLQIVSLVLLAQTLAYFYGWFRDRGKPADEAARGENRLILWSQQAIAAAYLVSALTKLIRTSGAWISQSPLMAIQIVKTNEQDFYDMLNPERVGAGLAMAEWMAHHPFIVATIMGTGLLLELTAPLLLLGRGWAAFYGLALISFHETVHRVMKLQFTYNEYLVWIYLVNVPFWALMAARWFSRRRATAPSA